MNFIYRGINSVEHNYNNDPNYINKLDELMNIKNCYTYEKNIDTTNIKMVQLNNYKIRKEFEENINNYLSSNSLTKLKFNFWKNKKRNHFDNGKINVAVHIRVYCTIYDVNCGRNAVSLTYYLNVMNYIRKKNNDDKREILFHIYGLGTENYFEPLRNNDTEFHINEDLTSSYIGMVAADILVTSPSSLSYSAAILSDGNIYYYPFWHPPKNTWFVCPKDGLL